MAFAFSPVRIAVFAAAVGWPAVAALAVVMWSKARARRLATRGAEVDARLRGLYRTVELRETPPRLAGLVDTLAQPETLPPPIAAKGGPADAARTPPPV